MRFYNVKRDDGELMLGSHHHDRDFAKAYCNVLKACERLKTVCEINETRSFEVVEFDYSDNDQ